MVLNSRSATGLSLTGNCVKFCFGFETISQKSHAGVTVDSVSTDVKAQLLPNSITTKSSSVRQNKAVLTE